MNAYHKTCWDISGSEEYKKAFNDAKKYVTLYNENGVDAIDDPVVRERLIQWEIDKGIV